MADTCCGAALELRALADRQRRVLRAVLAINAATFVMMVAGAALSGSSSLLSGALDNLGDALTYALSLAVIGSSGRAKAGVALFKGALILGAAVAVGVQIAWRLSNPAVPVFEGMGAAALVNLGANVLCLRLLRTHRSADVNMASAWECSRNDVFEGLAVVAAALGVGLFRAGWPDLVVAVALLVLFLRSATRVLRDALREFRRERQPPA